MLQRLVPFFVLALVSLPSAVALPISVPTPSTGSADDLLDNSKFWSRLPCGGYVWVAPGAPDFGVWACDEAEPVMEELRDLCRPYDPPQTCCDEIDPECVEAVERALLVPVMDELRDICRPYDPTGSCCATLDDACVMAVLVGLQVGAEETVGEQLREMCTDGPKSPERCCEEWDARCMQAVVMAAMQRVGSTTGVPFCVGVGVQGGEPRWDADVGRGCHEPPSGQK